MDFKTTVSLLYWVVAKALGHKMTCNMSLNPVMKNDITTKYVCYNWVRYLPSIYLILTFMNIAEK